MEKIIEELLKQIKFDKLLDEYRKRDLKVMTPDNNEPHLPESEEELRGIAYDICKRAMLSKVGAGNYMQAEYRMTWRQVNLMVLDQEAIVRY